MDGGVGPNMVGPSVQTGLCPPALSRERWYGRRCTSGGFILECYLYPCDPISCHRSAPFQKSSTRHYLQEPGRLYDWPAAWGEHALHGGGRPLPGFWGARGHKDVPQGSHRLSPAAPDITGDLHPHGPPPSGAGAPLRRL